MLRKIIIFLISWNCCIYAESSDKFECQDDIDESLNNLEQDDPKLAEIIGDYFLTRPASPELKYNIPRERLASPMIDGQFKQARIVDLFFNESKYDGFFIEAGAYDGFTVSNSLFFEAYRSWKGLLVEAHPDNYETLLSTNRKAWSVGTCLSMKSSPQTVLFDAATIFGGIIQEGKPKPGDTLPSNKRDEMKALMEQTRRTVKMQCLPLFSILKALGNPKVDYLSLDIEGAEEGVLETLPWDKVDISVIGLEIILEKHDEKASGEHFNSFPGIQKLLVSKGYDLVRTDWHTDEKKSLEAYFVQKDLAKKN